MKKYQCWLITVLIIFLSFLLRWAIYGSPVNFFIYLFWGLSSPNNSYFMFSMYGATLGGFNFIFIFLNYGSLFLDCVFALVKSSSTSSIVLMGLIAVSKEWYFCLLADSNSSFSSVLNLNLALGSWSKEEFKDTWVILSSKPRDT